MSFEQMSRDDWIVGGLALVLAITLLFLPWFSYTFHGVGTFTASATSAPDGWAGLLAFLASLAVLVDLLVERLAPQTTLPNLGGSRATTRLWLSVVVAVFVALKFVTNIHFSLFGFGFWVAIVFTAALVFVTYRLSQDQPLMSQSHGTQP